MHVSSKPFNTCSEPQLTHKVLCNGLTTVLTEQHMQKKAMEDAVLSKAKIWTTKVISAV